jgi:preprotein translocase subunit SecD
MNIWIKSLMAGLLGSFLIFFLSGRIYPVKKTKTYSGEYLVQVIPDSLSNIPFSFSRVIKTLDDRLKTAGYKYRLEETKNHDIAVSVSGLKDTVSSINILTVNTRVQFRELYSMADDGIIKLMTDDLIQGKERTVTIGSKNEVAQKVQEHQKDTTLADNLTEVPQNVIVKEGGLAGILEPSIPYSANDNMPVYPGEIGHVKVKDTARFLNLFGSEMVKAISPVDLQILFGPPDEIHEKKREKMLRVYFIRTLGSPGKALLENEDVKDASTVFSRDKRPEILLHFTKAGTLKWEQVTMRNVGKSIAIIIDGQVITAPHVNDVIREGSAIISGNYAFEEAERISIGIGNPKLPAALSIISSKIKADKSPGGTSKKILVALLSFAICTGLAFFIFKSLKTT